MRLGLSRIFTSLTCMVLMCGIAGCATFHLPFGSSVKKATSADPAIEILCLWQPGEGQDPEGRPCKGFQGQVLFLSRNTSTPVQVDGEVRIYLFDDQGTTDQEKAVPLHKYVFDSNSWNQLLAKSALGTVYCVFVPYTRHGVHEANCALRVRLKPKNGPTIYSEFSSITLGNSKKTLRGDDAKPITPQEAEQANIEELAAKLRRTTTISTVPNQPTTDTAKVAKVSSEPNAIQQASYQMPANEPAKASADAMRMQQLEDQVQQLMKQIATGASPSAQANSAPEEPQRLEDYSQASSGERLKLNSKRKARRALVEESERPTEPRRAHPLDDDQPAKESGRQMSAETSTDEDPFGPAIETQSKR